MNGGPFPSVNSTTEVKAIRSKGIVSVLYPPIHAVRLTCLLLFRTTFFPFTGMMVAYIFAAPVVAQDLFQKDHLLEIRIQFIDKDWDAKLDQLKQQESDHRLIAHVWLDGVKYENCGVRYKGNSSYFNVRNAGLKKLPFNIKSNERNKTQWFPGGVSALKLTNIFRDPSFVREVLAYEMAGRYMHTPRANFAKVFVNDEYYGIYTNTESIDEKFLSDHFGESSGTLFKCDPNWDAVQKQGCPLGEKASLLYLGPDSACYSAFYELDSDYGWNSLIELTRILNQQPEKIDSFLHIPETIWMLAFSNVMVNLDSYIGKFCHNFYLYRDSTGLYRPLIWDLNLCFGGFPFDGVTPTPLPVEKLSSLSLLLHIDNAKRPLISKILKDPTYRKMYIAAARTMYHAYISDQQYAKMAREWMQFIDREVNNDPQKLYSYESFTNNLDAAVDVGKVMVPGITELMDARKQYLANHPLLLKTPPAIQSPVVNSDSIQVTIAVPIAEAGHAVLYCRTGPHERFQKSILRDDGIQGDSVAADKVFTCVLPLSTSIEYYIWAENDQAGSFFPENGGIATIKWPSPK